MNTRKDTAAEVAVDRVTPAGTTHERDAIAVEEPMEIRLVHGPAGSRKQRSLSVTMRTPGADFDLAAGFLFTEGVIRDAGQTGQIHDITFCGPTPEGRETPNIVRVEIDEDLDLDLERLRRNFFTTSSCGICGKTSLDAVKVQGAPLGRDIGPVVDGGVIHELPGKLLAAQSVFESTGGLHAAALFNAAGDLMGIREDVGRHNAVDKLIGAELMRGRLPLHNRLMLVSGRTSFDILQKTATAGIPILVAVGAPSSLAVDLATRFQITLIGFVRDQRYNIYTGKHRIATAAQERASC